MAVKLPIEEQKKQLEILKNSVENTNKIAAIKAVRTIHKDWDLAVAKDFVENSVAKYGWNTAAFEDMRAGLSEFLDYGFTKEQFMSLVSDAYDAHQHLFEDPLESVLHALGNLREKGGLKYAAAKDQKFIDSL